MNKHTIDQLLSSAEVFHYARKYRGQTFMIVLEDSSKLEEIIEDLRLISLANIHTLICVKNAQRLASRTKRLDKLGLHIDHTDLKDLTYKESPTPGEKIEVLEFTDLKLSEADFWDAVINLTYQINASKFYYLSEEPGLFVESRLRANCTKEELDKLLLSGTEFNLKKPLLEFISNRIEHDLDLVVLSCEMGSLYQEIFTHYGCGTMFSHQEIRSLRKAKPADIMDIFWLMKPYIVSGLILPVTDDEILEAIESYFVLTVDSAVVACAKLTDYGDACEFAKLCALPRYRGRGRARYLVSRLIKNAANRKKTYMFALSVDPVVGDLFKDLGFYEVARESLPESWKSNYDFNRPSKAYRYDLPEAGLQNDTA